MALLTFTNPSITNTVVIDVDAGDRDDRVSKFRIAPSGTAIIDEADVNPYIGEGTECNSLPASLTAGILTVTEANIDNYTDLTKKNFIAGGLGLKYYYAGGSLTNTYIVVQSTSTGKVGYDGTLGSRPNLGVVRKDATADEYVRVKTSGTASITAKGVLTSGCYVAGDTDGKGTKVTAKGKYYVGTALSDATANQVISITIAPGVIV